MFKFAKIYLILFFAMCFCQVHAQTGQGTFSRISSLFSGLFSSEQTQYLSPKATIALPIAEVYEKVSSFDGMGEHASKYVSSWRSDDTRCSFSVKGFSFSLLITERVKNRYVKIESEDSCPVKFEMYIRLSSKSLKNTIEYLEVSAEMNKVLKATFGSKAQSAVNWANERLLEVVNN